MAANQGVTVKWEWRGGSLAREDDALWRLSPGVITGPKAWDKLRQEWGITGELPEVDFESELLLVAAGQGHCNHIAILELQLDASGDLRFRFGVTEMACPGFVYHILVIDRRGIKTLDGKPIPKA
jgi:hypothetical protein